MRFGSVMLATSVMLALAGCVAVARGGTATENVDWGIYGGDEARDHYSPLTQIAALRLRGAGRRQRTSIGAFMEVMRPEIIILRWRRSLRPI